MISASSSVKIAVRHKLNQLQGNQNLLMEPMTVIFKTNTAEVLSYYSVEPLYYTVNISAVKITVFRCVPFPAVLSLYFLH